MKTFKTLALALCLVISTLTSFNASAAETFKLDGRVNDASIDSLMAELAESHAFEPIDKIFVIELNSPGGRVYSGYRLLNQMASMQAEGRKFMGVVQEGCASMCFIIIQSMDIRAMQPYSTLMQHLPSGGNPEHLKAVERAIQRRVAARIGVPYPIWRQAVITDVWVGSQEALEAQLIDYILIKKLNEDLKGVERYEQYRK